jgi:hypothetical protein
VPGQINPNDLVLAQAGAGVATAQAAVPASGDLVAGSAAANSAASAIRNQQGALQQLGINADGIVGALAAPNNRVLLALPGDTSAASTVRLASASAGQLAGLSSMNASLGRASANLAAVA